jgi:hypothetical protein
MIFSHKNKATFKYTFLHTQFCNINLTFYIMSRVSSMLTPHLYQTQYEIDVII